MIQFNSKKEIQSAIHNQITSNAVQAVKAMLRIYEYQTESEKNNGSVTNDNGVGFTVQDADILTSFCKQYQTKGTLSPKQMNIVLKKVGKYAGQLTTHAIENGIYVKKDNKWVIAKA